MEDAAFHFPPDVFDAVVDAVPLLTRSKQDVVLFFIGCGVAEQFLHKLDLTESKYHLTKTILTHLNKLGERGLAQRRQVLKRVSDFDNFSTCYADNQLKAKGAVEIVAQLVNRKDSFTRLQQEHEDEQRRHREAKDAEARKATEKRTALQRVKTNLYRLFGESDPHRRGIALEALLNELFAISEIGVRESFRVAGSQGRAVEQIDGAVEIDGRLYLVEVKWWSSRLSKQDVSPHLVQVYSRGEVGGIIISASGFEESAITVCKEALAQRTVVLVELQEVVAVLDQERSLKELLRAKIREASLTKQPLTHPLAAESRS